MKKTPAKFDVSKADRKVIRQIVDRVVRHPSFRGERLNVDMDISACHRNGNRLDLLKLLAADDFNFWHDIAGISKNINRTTGVLENCFVPRCSAPKHNLRGRTNSADRRAQKWVEGQGAQKKPSKLARRFAKETNVKKMGEMLVDAVFGSRSAR